MTLERLFAGSPTFVDSELFAARVADRMNRGWGFRQFLISGLGMLGGLIGGAQVLGSGLASRLDAVTTLSRHAIASRLADLTDAHVLPAGLLLNGDIVWMAGALAVAAIVLALTRAIRDI
jgi:hypothetical protein